jgi:DNA invertase Pin-like site-specific DNA recombinase
MMRIIRKLEPPAPKLPAKKRVAAYARISSGKDASLQSLSAQISYYSGYIQRHVGWEYAGVYADEALTGTKDSRSEFQRLLADCRAGKIDIILTKSISRFARNTVDLLEAVRELRELNVDVYFERENIHSMSSDGELMLTILASFAQEESRSVSENCKWRIRKKFENGELHGLSFMYGYQIKKGKIKIDPKQAEVIRMIFNDYINGMGGSLIAKKLHEMKIPALHGGKWSVKYIIAIIQNEKYTGNALLQKTYIKDHLTKAQVWNRGVLPQYYVEGTHPAIIDMATFEKAKVILESRRKHYNTKDTSKNRYPFSGIIRCTNCGRNYKRKTTKGKVSWQCSTFLEKGKSSCHAKQIPEGTLYAESAEVLGLDAFDAEVFKMHITEIRVPEFNHLVFVFHDGHTVEKVWKDRSRSESWNDAMREDARQHQKGLIERRRD